jgi:hypothetical protein
MRMEKRVDFVWFPLIRQVCDCCSNGKAIFVGAATRAARIDQAGAQVFQSCALYDKLRVFGNIGNTTFI